MPADAPTTGHTELLLIRHAPALDDGRMAGRRDVAADCSDALAFAALRGALGHVDHILISPALRCQQTAATLWPDLTASQDPLQDPRLWEQDFGAWEDVPYTDLPDLGPLPTPNLAAHRPPEGESFLDLCHRATPALQDAIALGGKVAIVAHAGIIRAALGLALNAAAQGLTFQVAPLSLTSLIALPGGAFSIAGVNRMRR